MCILANGKLAKNNRASLYAALVSIAWNFTLYESIVIGGLT